MKEVLDSLLNAEAQAKELIRQGEVRVSVMTTEANDQARQLLQDRREASYREGQKLQQQARQQAQQDRRQKLERAKAESLKRVEIAPRMRTEMVRLACSLFTNTQ